MSADPTQVAELLVTTFAGRRDAFNRWTGSQYVALREELTSDVALEAIGSRRAVGAYFLPPSGETHVAAIDLDRPDGFELAKLVAQGMARGDVPAYVEPSEGGRAHLWVVADAVLPAIVWRRALRTWLADADVPTDDPKVELRPASDRLAAPDSLGSALRMPTMPHPRTGHRFPLCDAFGQSLGRSLGEMLLAVDWAPSAAVIAAAEAWQPPEQPLAAAGQPRPHYQGEGPIERFNREVGVSAVLARDWGAVNAQPGRSIRCPAHDDRNPSLSVARDDSRAWCHSPACDLHGPDGAGHDAYSLWSLAQERQRAVAV